MNNIPHASPLLIGILADVSASMRSAIGSSGTAAISRLQAFSDALEAFVHRAATAARPPMGQTSRQTTRLFVYGFGFNGLLTIFRGRGENVRDLLAPSGRGERTMDVLALADEWKRHLENVQAMALDMFGDTPMREAFALTKSRLGREVEEGVTSVLFVLSDGEPTDGTGDGIKRIADEIKRAGTMIVSCFVTDKNISEPKHLYGSYQADWSPAARLMFDCASELEAESAFETHLLEYKWHLDAQARLFTQVNHSETLEEFLSLVLSPLQVRPAHEAPEGEPDADERTTTTAPSIATSASTRQREKVRLLFLHGLGGDAQTTWGKFPKLLLDDNKMRDRYAVGFYSFPTTLFRLPFTGRTPKIQELARGLMTHIRYDELQRIDLVCHSLGGLIARRYLIEELNAQRPLRVEHLALFSVPHNGAGLASVAKLVSWRQNQIKQLCREADIIESMNEEWTRLQIQQKVKTKFIIGTQDQVVDRFSAAGSWGNPDTETITGRGHIDIVKPERPDDLVVRVLRQFLLS